MKIAGRCSTDEGSVDPVVSDWLVGGKLLVSRHVSLELNSKSKLLLTTTE